MKRTLVWSVLILAIPSLVACSGGDSTGDVVNNGGGSSTLSASVVPDMPVPTPGSVSLQEGSSSGNLVTVDAMVTDVSGVYSAAFDLVFNPAQAEFVGRSAGRMLESGGVILMFAFDDLDSFVDDPDISVSMFSGVDPGCTTTAPTIWIA